VRRALTAWDAVTVPPPPPLQVQGYQKGSVHVPLFEVDDDMSVSGLLKQMSAFGMGGWWLGGQHMKPNDQFMPQVLAKLQPDTKVRVYGWRLACGSPQSTAPYHRLACTHQRGKGYNACEDYTCNSRLGRC
jgi:hypothetical protein